MGVLPCAHSFTKFVLSFFSFCTIFRWLHQFTQLTASMPSIRTTTTKKRIVIISWLTHGLFQWLIVREMCVLICCCCFELLWILLSFSPVFPISFVHSQLSRSLMSVCLNYSIRFFGFYKSDSRHSICVPNWCVLSFNLIIANEINGVVNLFFLSYFFSYYTMRLSFTINVPALSHFLLKWRKN